MVSLTCSIYKHCEPLYGFPSHSKSSYASLRQYLITSNIKTSYCHEDRSYKALLLGTVLILLYCTVRGVCRNTYYMGFESYPEPKLSLTPQISTPGRVWKFSSSEHLLEIIAAHSFSLRTSQDRHRIRRHWQRGLVERRWHLLRQGLQLLAAPAAMKRGPGKVLRCSQKKACWRSVDPKGKLNEESGGKQVLQRYLQGKQKECDGISLPPPWRCLAKSQLMWSISICVGLWKSRSYLHSYKSKWLTIMRVSRRACYLVMRLCGN